MCNKPKCDVIFLQKSVFVCSVATCLAAPFFPGSPFTAHSIPLLVCTLGLGAALRSWCGAASDFPWRSCPWALPCWTRGQKSQKWQEALGRVQGGRQLPAEVAWRAQGWAEEPWQHKEKETCTVTWLGGEKGPRWSDRSWLWTQSTRALEHFSPNEDVSAGIQYASDEVVW